MLSYSSEITAPLPADPLDAVLQDLRLTGVAPGFGVMGHPWGIAVEPHVGPRLRLITSGTCWLYAPGGEWFHLRAGDAMLVSRGGAYEVSSAKGGRTIPLGALQWKPLGDRVYEMHQGGSGPVTTMFSCSMVFKETGAQPLLDLMPSLLCLRDVLRRDPILSVLFETMSGEFLMARTGSATILARLADVMISYVIRAWVEGCREETTGWMAAIHDPRIGRVLGAIHRHPGHPWSMESLAAIACISRSVFIQRFTQLMGVTPARYILRVRMHLASGWLSTDRVAVNEVADRLGYQSESAFSRAFSRYIGVAPSKIQHQDRERLGQAQTAQERRKQRAEDLVGAG
jgi:AraC-like DNA-binding protein